MSGDPAENRQSRVAPGRANHTAAGVRTRAALVQAVDRRAVSRPGGRRAQEEHLLQRELALENVALRKADDALDIGGPGIPVGQKRPPLVFGAPPAPGGSPFRPNLSPGRRRSAPSRGYA